MDKLQILLDVVNNEFNFLKVGRLSSGQQELENFSLTSKGQANVVFHFRDKQDEEEAQELLSFGKEAAKLHNKKKILKDYYEALDTFDMQAKHVKLLYPEPKSLRILIEKYIFLLAEGSYEDQMLLAKNFQSSHADIFEHYLNDKIKWEFKEGLKGKLFASWDLEAYRNKGTLVAKPLNINIFKRLQFLENEKKFYAYYEVLKAKCRLKGLHEYYPSTFYFDVPGFRKQTHHRIRTVINSVAEVDEYYKAHFYRERRRYWKYTNKARIKVITWDPFAYANSEYRARLLSGKNDYLYKKKDLKCTSVSAQYKRYWAGGKNIFHNYKNPTPATAYEKYRFIFFQDVADTQPGEKRRKGFFNFYLSPKFSKTEASNIITPRFYCSAIAQFFCFFVLPWTAIAVLYGMVIQVADELVWYFSQHWWWYKLFFYGYDKAVIAQYYEEQELVGKIKVVKNDNATKKGVEYKAYKVLEEIQYSSNSSEENGEGKV